MSTGDIILITAPIILSVAWLAVVVSRIRYVRRRDE